MRRWILLAVLSLSPGPALAQAGPVAPQLARQIDLLLAEKRARTPTERKIEARLLYAARQQGGQPAVPGLPFLRTDLDLDGEGRALVDVRAELTPRLLRRIGEADGRMERALPLRGRMRARLRLATLESIAALPEVRSLRVADRPYTRKIDTSEGDAAHRAEAVRTIHGVSGSGVTVGVLSDGVDSLATLQGSDDLPAGVTVLTGQAGSGDEGSAMLEIVHDLAPGADLLFATAFGGQASFAQNILDLRAAGADVLVDDVGYFAEAVFQDDDVAAAVDAVVDDGALYFSSAGNSGNLNDGTAGVWEGDFLLWGTVNGTPAHDFGGSAFNEIAEASPFLYTLQWSDPQGGSANDYDLLLVNKPMTLIVAASTSVQDGDDDPIEAIGPAPNDAGRHFVILQAAGDDRYLHLNTNRGELVVATAGQTSGHASARGAVAVAAVDVRDAAGPGSTFDGTESVQTYSSDGPRRVFYEADGTPITPGDLSSTGGELRAKPDVTAADCVSTASPGFATFCGTSAAAPHAAAIATLMLELGAGSGMTPGEVRTALEANALDIEAPGDDRDAGAGIVAALATADALAETCQNGADDDGDGLVDGDDPGCADPDDPSERDATLVCDNGLDDDDDDLADFVEDADGDGISDPPGDPGCRDPAAATESPACDDRIDNDGDGFVDYAGLDLDGDGAFDGPGEAEPDPSCVVPWQGMEASSSGGRCGLGGESVAALLLLLLRRRRASLRPSGAPRI